MAESDLDKLLKKHPSARPASEFKKLKLNLDVLETGVFPLDLAIGERGPDGRCGIRARDTVEICGFNNSFKTGTTDQLILTTQKRFPGRSVVALFSESPNYTRMEKVGINLDDLIIIECLKYDDIPEKCTKAEYSLETLIKFAELPEIKLCVIDSIAALITQVQIKDGKDYRDLDSSPVAALAKIVNNFLIQFKDRNDSSVLWMTNHYKEPVATGMGAYEKRTHRKTPGGRGEEFLADVRIYVNASAQMADSPHSIEQTKIARGWNISYEVFKNKYSHSTNDRAVTAYFDFKTAKINNAEKMLKYAGYFGYKDEKGNVASDLSVPVYTNGAWINIGKEKFQGTENAAEWLDSQPNVLQELKLELYKHGDEFFEDSSKKKKLIIELDNV